MHWLEEGQVHRESTQPCQAAGLAPAGRKGIAIVSLGPRAIRSLFVNVSELS